MDGEKGRKRPAASARASSQATLAQAETRSKAKRREITIQKPDVELRKGIPDSQRVVVSMKIVHEEEVVKKSATGSTSTKAGGEEKETVVKTYVMRATCNDASPMGNTMEAALRHLGLSVPFGPDLRQEDKWGMMIQTGNQGVSVDQGVLLKEIRAQLTRPGTVLLIQRGFSLTGR